MATREQYLELKKQYKRLAFENRKNRNLLKNAQRDGKWDKIWKYSCALERSKYEFRHLHIIASLLRGKTRDQIEPYVRYGNEPSETYLETLSLQYEVEKGIERPIREANHAAEIVCS